MGKARPSVGVALPSVANPAAEDAVRRDWIEANIAGGGSPEVIRDAVAPATPHSYKVWIDTSTTPPTVREWTGTAWQTVQATPSAHNHDTLYAAASHVGSRDGHPLATTTADGFMAGADKGKLAGIEAGAYKRPDRQHSAPGFTFYDIALSSSTWTLLQSGGIHLPEIAVAALGAPPSGTKWRLYVSGFLRVDPPQQVTCFVRTNIAGTTSGILGGTAILDGQNNLPLSGYIDPPNNTNAFAVRFELFSQSLAGTYSIFSNPTPDVRAFLVPL